MRLLPINGKAVEFTQGDDVVLELIAVDDNDNPQNLTGASLTSQILGANGVGPITFLNAQHTLANQSTNPGEFSLTLANAGADTASCGEGPSKQILTDAVIAGESTTYRGHNILTVYPPVPVQ